MVAPDEDLVLQFSKIIARLTNLSQQSSKLSDILKTLKSLNKLYFQQQPLNFSQIAVCNMTLPSITPLNTKVPVNIKAPETPPVETQPTQPISTGIM